MVTKKEHNIPIAVALVRKRERHDPMKSSRLKKTFAPSSTTLAISSLESSFAPVLPSFVTIADKNGEVFGRRLFDDPG